MSAKIVKKRGDSLPIVVNFKDANDAVIDISGWTVWLTVKKRITYVDADVATPSDKGFMKKVSAHSNPTQGQTLISVPPSTTALLLGTYHYDIQYKASDGTVNTLVKDIIVFEEDVTIGTT